MKKLKKGEIFIGISLFQTGNWSFVQQYWHTGAGHCPNIYTLASFLFQSVEDGYKIRFDPIPDEKPKDLSKRYYVALNENWMKELKKEYRKINGSEKYPDPFKLQV